MFVDSYGVDCLGSYEKKRAEKRQKKQREFLNDLGLFGEKNE
jgi:hypothetical protein